MKIKNILLLSWKKLWIIVVSWFVAVLLHNLVYGLFKTYFDAHGGDEPFFFIIAIIVIPLYFIISTIYTIIVLIKNKRERNRIKPLIISLIIILIFILIFVVLVNWEKIF